MELKCWKTFRKEGDVIPAGRGRPPLPPGQHAPQIGRSGNIGQDETHPDTPDCVTEDNERWGFFIYLFFAFFKAFFQVLFCELSQETKKGNVGFWGRSDSSFASSSWFC